MVVAFLGANMEIEMDGNKDRNNRAKVFGWKKIGDVFSESI